MKLCKTAPEKVILNTVKAYIEWIAPTYGPAGKKILVIQNEFNHEAVDDGKRATQNFEREDEFENSIVQYIKGVNEKCKDGNTTAGLIMGSILTEAFQFDDPLANTDYHGMALGLKKGLEEAVKQITKSAKKIKTQEELYSIALNAYNNEKIATLIAETVFKIGKDGKLDISDASSTETSVEIVNGMEIPKGYYSPYFINVEDKVVLENPLILVVNKKINLWAELNNILIQQAPNGQKSWINPSVVIIAEGFSEDVVMGMVVNKARFGLQPLLVEASGFGDKLENMQDLAVVMGATVVDDKLLKLKDVKPEHFGSCTTVKSLKDKTTFLGGKGQVKGQIEILKGQLEKSDNNFEKDKLTTRIAVLSGGIAVIKVGAYTENEQKGIKAKVENAVNSTLMAYRSGAVPGAGKALLDIKTSSELLNKALKAPREQLEKNGVQYLDENTVDPAEVVITALESAVSIAGGLLTMGGISVPKREKKEDTRF